MLIGAHRHQLDDDHRGNRVDDDRQDVRPDDQRPWGGVCGLEDTRERGGQGPADREDEGSEADVGGPGRMEDEVEAQEDEDDACGQPDEFERPEVCPTTPTSSSAGLRLR